MVAWRVSGAFCRWGRSMPWKISSGKRPPTPLDVTPLVDAVPERACGRLWPSSRRRVLVVALGAERAVLPVAGRLALTARTRWGSVRPRRGRGGSPGCFGAVRAAVLLARRPSVPVGTRRKADQRLSRRRRQVSPRTFWATAQPAAVPPSVVSAPRTWLGTPPAAPRAQRPRPDRPALAGRCSPA